MSKINEISCDCGCGAIEQEIRVFYMENDWCTLRYYDKQKWDNDKSDDLTSNLPETEFHFKSLECLNKWIMDKRINNESSSL